MPNLAITNDEIRENVATIIGVNRDPGEWDDEIFADVNRIIRAGRRKFFMANAWNFLEHDIQFVTDVPTLLVGSAVNGIITVTSGTVPDPAIGYYKVVPQEAGGVYDISDFLSNEITLTDTSVEFDSQNIVLYKYAYDLPANFAAFMDPVVVENHHEHCQLEEYATLPDFEIHGVLNRSCLVTGPPEIFAVTQSAEAETGDFSFFILIYPFVPFDETATPMARQYVIKTRIRIQPGDALDEIGEVFHPMFSELMQEAILATAEIMYRGAPGVHTALFSELLPVAVKRDREMRGVRRLIPRRLSECCDDNSEIRRAEIIFLPGALLP